MFDLVGAEGEVGGRDTCTTSCKTSTHCQMETSVNGVATCRRLTPDRRPRRPRMRRRRASGSGSRPRRSSRRPGRGGTAPLEAPLLRITLQSFRALMMVPIRRRSHAIHVPLFLALTCSLSPESNTPPPRDPEQDPRPPNCPPPRAANIGLGGASWGKHQPYMCSPTQQRCALLSRNAHIYGRCCS